MTLRDLDQTLKDFGIKEVTSPAVSFHKYYSGYEIILLATEIEKLGHMYYKRAQKLASSREMADEILKSNVNYFRSHQLF